MSSKITVIETPEFISRAKKLLDANEKDSLISYLSDYPEAGNIIQGTGGARKVRWYKGKHGKRGGNRVIYFYHNNQVPLFLLSVFSKNQRVDLRENEKAELKKILSQLVDTYKEGVRDVRYYRK